MREIFVKTSDGERVAVNQEVAEVLKGNRAAEKAFRTNEVCCGVQKEDLKTVMGRPDRTHSNGAAEARKAQQR